MRHVIDETKEKKRNSGNGTRRKNVHVSIVDDDNERRERRCTDLGVEESIHFFGDHCY